jgi:hypothetical protein
MEINDVRNLVVSIGIEHVNIRKIENLQIELEISEKEQDPVYPNLRTFRNPNQQFASIGMSSRPRICIRCAGPCPSDSLFCSQICEEQKDDVTRCGICHCTKDTPLASVPIDDKIIIYACDESCLLSLVGRIKEWKNACALYENGTTCPTWGPSMWYARDFLGAVMKLARRTREIQLREELDFFESINDDPQWNEPLRTIFKEQRRREEE